MSFTAERSARSVGIRDLLIAVGVAVVLGVVTALASAREGFPIIGLVLAWLVGLPTILLFLRNGLRLVRSDGRWRVQVDARGLVWDAPADGRDESFTLPLSEIDAVETIQTSGGGGKVWWRFQLLLRGGERRRLPQHAGIDPQQVLRALEARGIEHRLIRVPRGQPVPGDQS